MPIREFECLNEKCRHRSEKLLKMDDKTDSIECSKCGGKAIKVVSRGSFNLKGGGWTGKFHS